jgi:hypothetical protein
MSRRLSAVAVALACAAIVGLCVAFSGSLIDDAYIFFRYSDHLLAGHGPVFNVGERVEGFTSPLWLVLLAAGRWTGFRYESIVLVLGTLCATGAVAASWWLARTTVGPRAALLLPLLLAVHPGFSMWAVHGLETPLFVLLVTAGGAVWFAGGSRSAPIAGALLGLAFWTRPEGAVLVAVLAAGAVFRRQWPRVVGLAGLFGAIAVPLEIGRWLYYGELVPNTFHAKTGGGGTRLMFGLGYARRFVVAHLLVAAGCAVAAGIALGRARRRGGGVPAAVVDSIAMGVVWSLYVTWVGGDGFPGYRFWLPILPFAGLVAAWGLETLLAGRRAGGRLLAAATVTIALVTALSSIPEARLEHDSGREFTAKMTAAGRWLGDHAPPGTTLAVNYVGALPYHAGLPTIDMLGLTDPEIARTPIRGRFRFPGHAKGNGDSVLRRRPDLILMGGVYLEREPMETLAPELTTEDEIARDPRFVSEYEPVQVRLEQDGRWFAFYKRKELKWNPER